MKATIVKNGGVALAGKAGGAIHGRLEFFGSFLFQDKKERKERERNE